MTRFFTIMALALLLGHEPSSRPALAGDEAPGDRPKASRRAPERTREFEDAVNRAIARGLVWLREQQLDEGYFSGRHWELSEAMKRALPEQLVEAGPYGREGPAALGILTLSACGEPRDEGRVRRGLEFLRRVYGPGGDSNEDSSAVYGIALTLLALEAYHDPNASGDRHIPEGHRRWIDWMARELASAQVPSSGGFGYAGARRRWDNSNSQYALLGLHAARMLGARVRPSIWRSALEHWLRTQKKGPEVDLFERGEGEWYALGRAEARGWSYSKRSSASSATGSMTVGGLSSVVICRSALIASSEGGFLGSTMGRRSSKALRDGFAWLARHFRVSSNPSQAGSARTDHYYYLYGLERAGILGNTDWIGTHDWYGEGAEYLVEVQLENGSWLARETVLDQELGRTPFFDTCFALLFLRRATRRLVDPAVTNGEGGGTTTPGVMKGVRATRADGLDEESFRTLFKSVFAEWMRVRARSDRDDASAFVRLGPRAVRLLILRLSDSRESVRAAAWDALSRTTSGGPAFGPGDPAREREKAAIAWERWWMVHRAKVERDDAQERFVQD